MAQSAKSKLAIIGVIAAIAIIGLAIWTQQKKPENQELVIGISPSFAKPLQAAAAGQADHAEKSGKLPVQPERHCSQSEKTAVH